MKKALNFQFLTMVLLTFSLAFIGCETKKNDTKKVATTYVTTEQTNVIPTYREPLVFITGKERDSFYINAKKYYENKQFEVVTEAFSLQEIIDWLNNNFDERLYTDIYIVSKSNPWKGLDMEASINSGNLTLKSLRNALIDGKLPKLTNGITDETSFIFDASTLADNTELLETLKAALSSTNINPTIIATPFYNIYGGAFSDHNLAKPYFGFYPTAQSPGKTDLSKEFAKKYPNEKEINWYDALNNESERYVGEAYTIQYNFPVQWEFSYNGDEEVPYFEDAEEIMTWIRDNEELYNEIKAFNIPLEKFRWDSKTKSNKLIIKGITTVLCVLKPLIKPYGDLQHIEPEIDNLRLYTVQ